MANPKVFFNMAVNGQPAGRIVIEVSIGKLENTPGVGGRYVAGKFLLKEGVLILNPSLDPITFLFFLHSYILTLNITRHVPFLHSMHWGKSLFFNANT